MNTHTPGLWSIGPHQRIISRGWGIRISDDSAIAYVLGEKNPELQANARLIAAAPDILEALQRLIDAPGHGTHEAMRRAYEAASAAVAKATQDDTP